MHKIGFQFFGGRGSSSGKGGGGGGGSSVRQKDVTVRDSEYRFAHGKAPSGLGNWAFHMGRNGSLGTQFFYGKFSESKKKAIKWAAEHGTEYVSVGS